MTKKVDTWMPLLVDKYLGDTMLLTTEQHGAYLLLLMTMWKKDGRLPDNDQQLAQAAKLGAARWKATRPILIDGTLLRAEGGFIVQKRLSAELERSKAHAEAKAEAGAKGAAKRWQQGGGMEGSSTSSSTSSANGTTNGTAMADASRSQSQTGASISTPVLTTFEQSASSNELATPRPSADGHQMALVEDQPERHDGPPPCPHQTILAVWAEVLPELPQHKVERWKGARADHLRARWREEAVERKWATVDEGVKWFRRLFFYIGQSRFLTGKVSPLDADQRPFQIELEWLVHPGNFAKVIEGKYHRDTA